MINEYIEKTVTGWLNVSTKQKYSWVNTRKEILAVYAKSKDNVPSMIFTCQLFTAINELVNLEPIS